MAAEGKPVQVACRVLAYFATGGVSNGGTEAINLIIKKSDASPTASATSPTSG
jgi:hypothetical protein